MHGSFDTVAVYSLPDSDSSLRHNIISQRPSWIDGIVYSDLDLDLNEFQESYACLDDVAEIWFTNICEKHVQGLKLIYHDGRTETVGRAFYDPNTYGKKIILEKDEIITGIKFPREGIDYSRECLESLSFDIGKMSSSNAGKSQNLVSTGGNFSGNSQHILTTLQWICWWYNVYSDFVRIFHDGSLLHSGISWPAKKHPLNGWAPD